MDAPSLHSRVDILQTIPAEIPRVLMLNLASQEGLTIQPHDLQDLLAQKQIQVEDFQNYLLAEQKQKLVKSKGGSKVRLGDGKVGSKGHGQ